MLPTFRLKVLLQFNKNLLNKTKGLMDFNLFAAIAWLYLSRYKKECKCRCFLMKCREILKNKAIILLNLQTIKQL